VAGVGERRIEGATAARGGAVAVATLAAATVAVPTDAGAPGEGAALDDTAGTDGGSATIDRPGAVATALDLAGPPTHGAANPNHAPVCGVPRGCKSAGPMTRL
jgi:hypothetical protein